MTSYTSAIVSKSIFPPAAPRHSLNAPRRHCAHDGGQGGPMSEIRGLDLRVPMRLGAGGIDGLLDRMRQSSFQGRKLGEAFDVWKRMIDGKSLIALGVAGSLASAGMGPLIAWLVERGYVDVV